MDKDASMGHGTKGLQLWLEPGNVVTEEGERGESGRWRLGSQINPSPTLPSFLLPNIVLYLGIPCALVKLMEMRPKCEGKKCGENQRK